MKRAVVLALLLLAGCNTVEDVRERPPVWTATVPGYYEDVAGCLSGKYASEINVIPQVQRQQRVANVTLAIPSAGVVIADFTLRAVSDTSTEVSWRHKTGSAGRDDSIDRKARERTLACGKAA